ncbi:hypothetical protein [Breoghania sp. L-A4]|uniref:hypothetical protein n=1 Tax=Breoghania sp. L-A4 TaxID=2304600 RepID=UPI000E35E87E|nr:hypothetical protein [Breoghania sp. L-A4]AXS39627.1 hypothetical protein D1F64_05640 [Breoghania sp. L-A4]
MNIVLLMFLALALPVGLYLSIGALYFISWTSDLIENQDKRVARVLLAGIASLFWPLSVTATSAGLSLAAVARRSKTTGTKI